MFYKSIWHLLILAFLGATIYGCTREERTVTPAFYHWRTSLEYTATDKAALDTLGVQKLYVKYFDVVWDPAHGPMPTAKVKYSSHFEDKNIVPTIFITNEVFQNLDAAHSSGLAHKVHRLVSNLYRSYYTHTEYQLDCDWTESTRDKYFDFIKAFKVLIDTADLSVTLRLHQLKYWRKTGVPPADRAMLMFYNLNSPSDPAVSNSILELDEAKKYFSGRVNYPLQIDVVLPIFSWGLLFRYGEFLGIFNNMNSSKMKQLSFFSLQEKNIYICTKDTFYNNRFFRYGDILRVEEVTQKDLMQSAKFLSDKLPEGNLTVALYHYDPELMKQYNEEDIKKLYAVFK